MADYIPEQILNRKKQGFSAPDENWYRGENADYIKEILMHSDTYVQNILMKITLKK